ncbi:CHAT domain-containing protein [Acrocarpospora sp. B8E8]|uniref:CHAT domain-containing protein n=1 Tax=Acrocarpospora sp. B8E8 TaxID=3153572 RepID=UPI00325D5DCC
MITSILRVGPAAEGGYPAALYTDRDAAAGAWTREPVARCVIPASPSLREARAVLLGVPDPAVRRATGEALYDLVAATDVGRAWTDLRDSPMRTYLDIRPVELRALPWELMTDPDRRHLFLDDERPCLRGDFQPGRVGEFLVPIRLLIAVGNARDPDLRAADEVDAIRSALGEQPGAWHAEVLWEPTPTELFERFEALQPHVFHFIGHAGTDPFDDSPMLELVTGAGVESVTSEMVGNALRGGPRIVFLNACRTSYGQDAAEAQRATWAMAGAFEARGADAVLAMQGDIPSPSAVAFAGRVYAALAAGDPLDAAVRRARRALFTARDPAWALPSLLVRREPEHVLPWRLGVARQNAERATRSWYPTVLSTIDRTAEHWRLWGGPGFDAPWQALLLRGEAKAGKTSLLRSAMFTWHLRGCHAGYVDVQAIKDGKNVSCLDILRAVAGTLADAHPEPVRRFRHALVHLRQGRLPPPEGLDPDDGGRWEPAHEGEPELRARLFAAMRALLAEAAGDGPLIIALDHAGSAFSLELTDYLVPGLLVPIAAGEVPGVRIIVAERNADGLGDYTGLAESLEVEKFPQAQTVRIFREYGARVRRPYRDQWKEIVETLSTLPGPWLDPSRLTQLHTLLPPSAGKP